MTSALQKTIDFLAASENSAATDLLLHACDSAEPRQQQFALQALLDRHDATTGEALILRLKYFGPAAIDRMRLNLRGLSLGIAACLTKRDASLGNTACHAAAVLRDYDQIPLLAEVAQDASHPAASAASIAVVELAEH